MALKKALQGRFKSGVLVLSCSVLLVSSTPWIKVSGQERGSLSINSSKSSNSVSKLTPSTDLQSFFSMLPSLSDEKLNFHLTQTLSQLTELLSKKDVDKEVDLHSIQVIVMIGSEKIRRASQWNLSESDLGIETRYSITSNVIKAYLSYIEDEKIVHKATKQARADALRKARGFRGEASSHSGTRYGERYILLAQKMHLQAGHIDGFWSFIRKGRPQAERILVELEKSRNLYAAVQETKTLKIAEDELADVQLLLAELTLAANEVQSGVLEANATAGDKWNTLLSHHYAAESDAHPATP